MPVDRTQILSKYIQILDEVEASNALELDSIKSKYEEEIKKYKSELQSMIARLGQAEDTVKIQKRTILSLQNELDAKPVLSKFEPEHVEEKKHVEEEKKQEDEKKHVEEKKHETYVEEKKHVDEAENEGPELIPVILLSGTYFWNQDTGDLYDFISDEEAGEIVGFIKSVKIKKQLYYLDTCDNNFYKHEDDDMIGKHIGQIIDNKAIFM